MGNYFDSVIDYCRQCIPYVLEACMEYEVATTAHHYCSSTADFDKFGEAVTRAACEWDCL